MSSKFPTNPPYIKTAMQGSDFRYQNCEDIEHKGADGLRMYDVSKTPSCDLVGCAVVDRCFLAIEVEAPRQDHIESSTPKCRFRGQLRQSCRCWPRLREHQGVRQPGLRQQQTDGHRLSMAHCDECVDDEAMHLPTEHPMQYSVARSTTCLLYTSDAADD